MLSQFPQFTRSRHGIGYTKPNGGRQQLFLRKLRTKLILPAEQITNTWRGASEIVRKFKYISLEPLTFLDFFVEPPYTYVAVVEWDNGDLTKTRYKLWNGVGEILYVPNYNGQIIPTTFAIEIWNINVPTVVIDLEEIYLSKLILSEMDLYTCALEENNRLHVITSSGSGILDELGNIILDEGGNTLQPE